MMRIGPGGSGLRPRRAGPSSFGARWRVTRDVPGGARPGADDDGSIDAGEERRMTERMGGTGRDVTGHGGAGQGGAASARAVGAAADGAEATRWSKAARHAFLDHLSMTGDVAVAAAAAGMSVTAAYAKRRREPGFAREWRDAAAAAWERLEAAVLRQVLEQGERPGGAIEIATAMQLLARRPGAPAQPAAPRSRKEGSDVAGQELLRRLSAQARRGGAAEPA